MKNPLSTIDCSYLKFISENPIAVRDYLRETDLRLDLMKKCIVSVINELQLHGEKDSVAHLQHALDHDNEIEDGTYTS